MKKILMAIFTIMLFFSVGCSNRESDDSLIDSSSNKIQESEIKKNERRIFTII